MASVKKFTKSAVVNILRHVERTIKNPANQDIDSTKINKNYFLSPDRKKSSYDYFKERKKELYCHNRADVNVMVGWVVTIPKDAHPEDEEKFFQTTYNFLEDRYGEANVVQSIVHKDESGQPHLHFNFIPTVPDKNPKHESTEKICAWEVINKKELQKFHPDLQKYLKNNGVKANIVSGITKAQGGNKTVWEMKQERERSYEREIVF